MMGTPMHSVDTPVADVHHQPLDGMSGLLGTRDGSAATGAQVNQPVGVRHHSHHNGTHKPPETAARITKLAPPQGSD